MDFRDQQTVDRAIFITYVVAFVQYKLEYWKYIQYTHTHTHARTHTHSHTYTHIHALRMHVYACMYTHTHTHTGRQGCIGPKSQLLNILCQLITELSFYVMSTGTLAMW